MTAPSNPSTAYLDALYAGTARRMADSAPLRSPHRGAAEPTSAALTAAVTRYLPELVALSHAIHDHPELAYQEQRAVAAVAELLQRHGHEVEVGAFGISTALRAVAGSGEGPRVAVVAEYDALPGVGHACGHNVICASAVGAWLALAEQLPSLGGTVELLGTPAEEGGAGKVHMLDAGAFDGFDAAVMVHPFSYDVATHPFLGRRVVDVTYHGVAAHAAAMPFMGRNALDAAVAAYSSVNALRQHLPASDRVHGIVTEGGDRPNVVPARAALQYYVRSADSATLSDLCERLHGIFAAAADMTGTEAEITWDPVPPYLPIRHNHTLAARWAHQLGGRGRSVLPDGVVPETLAASTDFGNVSERLPAIHPMLAIAPPEVSLHTTEFASYARGAEGDRGVADGAAGLAGTVADFLADGELRAAVREEFEAVRSQAGAIRG